MTRAFSSWIIQNMATGDPSVLQMPYPHWSPFNDYGSNPPSSRTARNLHPHRVGGQVELAIAGWASGFEQEVYVTSSFQFFYLIAHCEFSIDHPSIFTPTVAKWFEFSHTRFKSDVGVSVWLNELVGELVHCFFWSSVVLFGLMNPFGMFHQENFL